MSQISTTTFPVLHDKDTVTEAVWDQILEVIRVAINDNYARLLKSYTILDSSNGVKSTQSLTDILNYFKIKEGNNISILHDPVTSTITLNATGVISGTVSDNTITTVKIVDGNVTKQKLETSVQTSLDLVATNAAKLKDAEILFWMGAI